MLIASWNVRGFGSDNKKSMIRNFIKEEHLDLRGLVETKHHKLVNWELRSWLGHQSVEFMDVAAQQGSGGLILTWKAEAFTLRNSFAKERWICVEGTFHQSQFNCAICLLYAPNDQQERSQVLAQLRAVRARVGSPLIIMGGFNKVLRPHERSGGSVFTQGMRDFSNLISDLQLMDMDIGQSFTWIRKNAASRIDRVLVDGDLIQTFPDSHVFCKGRMFSDHFPLIFSTTNISWNPSPFRSLDCWLEEPSFESTFKKEWLMLTRLPLERKLKLIKKSLRNRDVLGHIETKIRHFKQALGSLEKEVQARS